MMIVTSVSGVATPLNAAARASTAATNLFAMIDMPPRDTSGKKDPDVSANGDIVFMNVNFAYPGRADVKVLQGLNVKFPVGKITAIVGPSGSGKSTIVGLIERWYELDGDWTNNLKVSAFPPSRKHTNTQTHKQFTWRADKI
jgi:ABC-type multidrug transport system fused ATPase/permease subunit